MGQITQKMGYRDSESGTYLEQIGTQKVGHGTQKVGYYKKHDNDFFSTITLTMVAGRRKRDVKNFCITLVCRVGVKNLHFSALLCSAPLFFYFVL